MQQQQQNKTPSQNSIDSTSSSKSSAIRNFSRRAMLTGLISLLTIGTIDTTIKATAVISEASNAITSFLSKRKYTRHHNEIRTAAWSPNGKYVASGSKDKTIQIWQASNGKHVFTWDKHTNPISSIVWSPNGQYIASASIATPDSQHNGKQDTDNVVQIWHATKGTLVATYTAASNPIAWFPDSQRIALTHKEINIHVWNIHTGKQEANYENLATTKIAEITSQHNNLSILINEKINTGMSSLKLQTLTTNNTHDLGSYDYRLAHFSLSPDAKQAAIGLWNELILYNTTTNSQQWSYSKHDHLNGTIAWSPNGKYIAIAAHGGSEDLNTADIHIIDANSGKHIYTYQGHTNYLYQQYIQTITWSPDSKYIASGGTDNTVHLWELPQPH